MATFYARVTPINGVSGDVFGVDVSGVTATVEGNKTWTGGELAFAITPTGWGNMVVTFKNITLNTVIGTKTIPIVNNEATPIGDIGLGTYTITCGKSNQVGTSNVYYYGYGNNLDNTKYGTLLSSNFRYYEKPLGLDTVWLMPGGGNNIWLHIRLLDYTAIPSTLKCVITFTNLTTNETMSIFNHLDNRPLYGYLQGIVIEDSVEISKWLRIFTPGQQIRMSLTAAAANLQP